MSTTDSTNIPYGYCHCGCGEKTRIAKQSSTRDGTKKGEPIRWIKGHNNRRHFGPEYEVDPATKCWIWQLGYDRKGYGRCTINETGSRHAYRRNYIRAKGPIPDGLILHHLCDNPACVNPDHLIATTQKENVREGKRTHLTYKDVYEIRELYASGQKTKVELAEQYRVSWHNVHDVINEKTWA